MKFLATLLLALISNSFAFNYDRMLTRQGYVNQGDGYYFRFDNFIESEYLNYFKYSECGLIEDALFCRTISVDCDDYHSGIYDTEVYYNGIKHSENGAILKISNRISKEEFPGEYELWGYNYSFNWGGITWRYNAIEEDSYEDRVCSEIAESELTIDE